MLIRPMEPGDVEAADLVARDAFGFGTPYPDAGRGQRRIRHLLGTDPDGAWVAVDEGGDVVGCALGIVREGVWGLSLLVVRPDVQARGIGRRLLDAALACAEGTRAGIILSSPNPGAMRRYARAGFALRPLIAAAGIVDRSRIPALPAVREGTLADVEATAPISRAVRGATHHHDLGVLLELGLGLLLHAERGFAVHDAGSPKLLAARDEEAAAELLWACLAATPRGGTVGVDFISAGQDWAVRVALDAGLELSPDGPLFVRGAVGPLRPYLPSGAYL